MIPKDNALVLLCGLTVCVGLAMAGCGGSGGGSPTGVVTTAPSGTAPTTPVTPAPVTPPSAPTPSPTPTAIAGVGNGTITVTGNFRYIGGNGIPNHATGQFPNPGNPNTISPQNYNFRVPLSPQAAAQFTEIELGKWGVAINSVPFDPTTAGYFNNDPNSGWHYEAISPTQNLGIDQSGAHVQPNGAYHYHGVPTGLLDSLNAGTKMTLIGFAADGFPVYGPYAPSDANSAASGTRRMRSSYRLKSGTRPSGPNAPGGVYDGTFGQDYEYVAGLGDLDEANGRAGVAPEFPGGTYYYVVTSDFPFIPRKLRGAPDSTFAPPPGGGPSGGGAPPTRP